MKNQTGILLVAFGTSEPDARVAYDNVLRLARLRFPSAEIRWAFTSRMIREKLSARGEATDSTASALEKFQSEGFSRVVVQSLHVIAGAEYDRMRGEIAEFTRKQAFQKLSVGLPLFASHSDIERLADVLLREISQERRADEAMIFMGHGSAHHPADIAYIAAHAVFQKRDEEAFVATVEGYPTIEEIIFECQSKNVRKVLLVPLMLVAGEHVRKDLAGDLPGSWKNQLALHGIESDTFLKGLGEFDAVAEIWLDHLDRAHREL